MMKNIINNAVIFLFVFAWSIDAQPISIIIREANFKHVLLLSLKGEKSICIDSIKSQEKNNFKFNLDNLKNHHGMYRALLQNNKSIDFIFDGERINIETNANNIWDSLVVIGSECNKLYYSFINLNKKYIAKTELLRVVLARYPKDDDYFRLTENKLLQLQNEYLIFIKNAIGIKPNSFISKYIKTSQMPIVNYNLTPEEQLYYLKAHALDNVAFNSDELIYSDAFTNKTIEYLTYYRNSQLPKELLEKEFMIAVDTILNRAKVNEIVYQQIVEYLIDGFKEFGFDTVLNYIVENYVIKDDLCLDFKTEGMIKNRIDQAKFLHIGGVVPSLSTVDSEGKVIELNDIKSDKVLIVFYASWCPHCQKLLPEIRDLYNNQKEKSFDVIAISLDTSKTDWNNFVKTNSLNFINACDLKGWDGKAAREFYLYATPTMFIIDNKMKIIGKPVNLTELSQIMLIR